MYFHQHTDGSHSKGKSFKGECCEDRKHVIYCEQTGINASLIFDRKDITIFKIEFTYKRNFGPYVFVYKTENDEEILISYSQETGNLRGSFDSNDGRSFTFYRCLDDYVFLEYDPEHLRFKEKNNDAIIINEDDIKKIPRPVSGKRENTYSIMFYFTQELASSKDFLLNTSTNSLVESIHSSVHLKEYFKELIQKTNMGYENSNIPIRAKMHCFEMATIRDNASDNATVILEEFRKMKGTPERLRNTADIAVLLTNDLKDSCGEGYYEGYKHGWTFAVTSRVCAISRFTFSHEIGHIFGALHSSGYFLNKRGSKGPQMLRTIMQYERDGMSSRRINYYSNPNIIDPQSKSRKGKPGMLSNHVYFSKNIYKIAALGNESCKCWLRLGDFGMNLFDMTADDRAKMDLLDKKSCLNTGRIRGSILSIADMEKKNPTKAEIPIIKELKEAINKDHRYHHLIPLSMQELFQNYLNDAQSIYIEYLKNAHTKIHEMHPTPTPTKKLTPDIPKY